ncbi:phage terminase large subunit family protein [Pseudooceanicola sp. CBS1P-1]|uniref:Terminase n=1 Tax=Pseudooceanicola albus TaxID=2692189 RepID=A0A6L7GAV8_9RHOB|nr:MULTISPECIES: terminase gpA endonuclease subunit [Pseudooceanicola]MBT9386964.1 phage terminase large subunit family protein [Pseudooceanicola endophyticus]MXN21185.1 terminase [Pseudooceanicola albus]
MVMMADRAASVLHIPPLPAWRAPTEILADSLPLLDPPSRITVTDAAERHLRVPIAGDWRSFDRQVAPYTVEPADVTQSRRFKAVCFVGPSQSGKTQMLMTVAAHAITSAPDPVQVIHMTKTDADAWVEEKLNPAIRNSPEIHERLGRGRDDDTFSRKRFRGMRLAIGYPVANQLSSRSQRLVLMTDYDHMKQILGPKDAPEGSPYGMARQRIRTFMSRGCVLLESTPAFPVTDPEWRPGLLNPHELPPVSGGIVRIYNEGTRGRWYWECRNCGELFEPHFTRLLYDDGLEPAEAGAQAQMECPHCGELYAHRHKVELNRRALAGQGGWLHEGTRIGEDGHRALVRIDDPALRATDVASYSLNGAAAAFASWEGLVSAYELARRQAETFGDYTELSRVFFTDRAEPFLRPSETDGAALTTTQLREAAVTLPRGVAPGWTRFLTVSVDVQGNRFEVLVMAWGLQGERIVIERFAISQPPDHAPRAKNEDGRYRLLDPGRYGEDADALLDLASRAWPVEGQPWALTPAALVIDFNGPPGWSDKAEAFWRARRRDGQGHLWFLSIGRGGFHQRDRVWHEAPERGSRGRKARGIKLLNMAVDRLKDSVLAALGRMERGMGAQHLPDWLETEALAELLAEERGLKGYTKKQGVTRNETLDLSVQALALAEHKGLNRMNPEAPPDWAVLGPQNVHAVATEEKRRADPPPEPPRAVPAQINFLKRR